MQLGISLEGERFPHADLTMGSSFSRKIIMLTNILLGRLLWKCNRLQITNYLT